MTAKLIVAMGVEHEIGLCPECGQPMVYHKDMLLLTDHGVENVGFVRFCVNCEKDTMGQTYGGLAGKFRE